MSRAKGARNETGIGEGKFVRGDEEMLDEIWARGEGHLQPAFAELTGKAALLRRELKSEMPG